MAGRGNLKHGMTDSREYRIWTNIKTRCFNTRNPRYRDYGGRGISMCSAWASSFAQFLQDMGPCPAGLTIERRDSSKGKSIFEVLDSLPVGTRSKDDIDAQLRIERDSWDRT